MLSEFKDINAQIESLNNELKSSKIGYMELKKTRSILEDETRVKRKTLWIDCVRLQNVRKCYPSLNSLIGH